MKGFKGKSNIVILIVSFLLFSNTVLFANSTYSEESYIKSAYSSESITNSITSVNSVKNIEVSLNSFGSISVMVMLILTSVVGVFFVRDEFSEVLD